MLSNKPCKIGEISVSKTGKHGHAKAKFVGTHIFTKAKVEDSQSTSHGMRRFDLIKNTYTLVGLTEDTLDLQNENGDTKSDLDLPSKEDPELAVKIKAMYDVWENQLSGASAQEKMAKYDGVGDFDC